ncbi:hypothetical protein Ahia01_000991500, partial [Argonauta hians]
ATTTTAIINNNTSASVAAAAVAVAAAAAAAGSVTPEVGGLTPDLPVKVLFLMPCHSTPYYSYIHSPVGMRFLTCEPDLPSPHTSPTSPTPYLDEADMFYLDPVGWLRAQYNISGGGGGGVSGGSKSSSGGGSGSSKSSS